MIDIDVGTNGPAKDVYSAFALESDIYDLKRMLHAAELLQIDGDGDEEFCQLSPFARRESGQNGQ